RSAPRRGLLHLPLTDEEARLEAGLLTRLADATKLKRALHCADVQGVSALDALIACTDLDPDDIAARLAERLRIAPLTRLDVPAHLLPANAANAAFQTGLLRLADGRFIAALRGRSVIALARLLEDDPAAAASFRLASPSMFLAAVLHAAG